MNKNTLTENLTNFLIPIISIYSISLIVRSFEDALLAVLYSVILFLILILTYSLFNQKIQKITLKNSIKFFVLGLFCASFTYLIFVFSSLAL